jgi:hypothetical protein
MSTPGDPCGEAPILLAGSIHAALRHALRSFGLEPGLDINIPFPATPPLGSRYLQGNQHRPPGKGRFGEEGSLIDPPNRVKPLR